MVFGGDFNDIRNMQEKRGGRRRSDASFQVFNSFITQMGMDEINSVDNQYTWANNREGEGYVEEKLDRFFGAASWVVQIPRAKVLHIDKQSSDHSLLILDTKPLLCKYKSRFCFDKRWLLWEDIDRVVEGAWNMEQEGSLMYQVCARIRGVRAALFKWSKGLTTNSRKRIEALKLEMNELNSQEGQRDWQQWFKLRGHLHEAYKQEETYWSQKSQIQ